MIYWSKLFEDQTQKHRVECDKTVFWIKQMDHISTCLTGAQIPATTFLGENSPRKGKIVEDEMRDIRLKLLASRSDPTRDDDEKIHQILTTTTTDTT